MYTADVLVQASYEVPAAPAACSTGALYCCSTRTSTVRCPVGPLYLRRVPVRPCTGLYRYLPGDFRLGTYTATCWTYYYLPPTTYHPIPTVLPTAYLVPPAACYIRYSYLPIATYSIHYVPRTTHNLPSTTYLVLPTAHLLLTTGIHRGTYGYPLLGPVPGSKGAYEGKSPGYLRRPTVRPRTRRYTADVIVQSPYEDPVAAERPC